MYDSTENLPQNNKVEGSWDQGADGCSWCGQYCSHYDASFDSFDVEDPVGGKIGDDIKCQIAHGDNGDYCIGLMVGLCDGDWNGGDYNPANAVDQGEQAEDAQDEVLLSSWTNKYQVKENNKYIQKRYFWIFADS